MSSKPFRPILYAVGSLPFWTGLRKLKNMLRGVPGSYWKGSPPLKPTFLNHHFYGWLSDTPEATLNRSLRRLRDSGYLKRENLSADKPYKVIKLTDKGVRQYYNLLVSDRGNDSPTWRIHHLSQMNSPPNSLFETGGEILAFSGKQYLTQTPGFNEPDVRVQDESTVSFYRSPEGLRPGSAVLLRDVNIDVGGGVRLKTVEETRFETVSQSDLRQKLTHFPPREPRGNETNPYVLSGELIEKQDAPGSRAWRLTFRNEEDERVLLYVNGADLPDDQPIETGSPYAFGPVKTHPAPVEEQPHAQLILSGGGGVERRRVEY